MPFPPKSLPAAVSHQHGGATPSPRGEEESIRGKGAAKVACCIKPPWDPVCGSGSPDESVVLGRDAKTLVARYLARGQGGGLEGKKGANPMKPNRITQQARKRKNTPSEEDEEEEEEGLGRLESGGDDAENTSLMCGGGALSERWIWSQLERE